MLAQINLIQAISSFTALIHLYNKNSSEDEIANVNILRRHRTCRGQSLRPL